MIQLSEKLLNFAPSVVKTGHFNREEQLSFDPLVNLENSSVRAKSLKAASPAVAYILLTPLWSQLTYIPAGVSCFSF